MPAVLNPDQVTVFMPVGGRATRALSVTADLVPKHLIKLGNGLPILETMCRQLQIVGFRKFVFCTCHHQEQTAEFVLGEQWVCYDEVTYKLSVETEPLGPEGAILAAVETLGATGQAMFIAGDVMVPWDGLVMMNEHHANSGASVTAGLTSCVTERTTDVGKFIVDPTNGRVLRLYGRTEKPLIGPNETALTSAGLTVVTIEPYVTLCHAYKDSRSVGDSRPFGLRDDVLPWALKNGSRDVYGYDLQGEVLDLGTPDNIRYGQENWRDYVLN